MLHATDRRRKKFNRVMGWTSRGLTALRDRLVGLDGTDEGKTFLSGKVIPYLVDPASIIC